MHLYWVGTNKKQKKKKNKKKRIRSLAPILKFSMTRTQVLFLLSLKYGKYANWSYNGHTGSDHN